VDELSPYVSLVKTGLHSTVSVLDLSKETNFSSSILPVYFSEVMGRLCRWLELSNLKFHILKIPEGELPHYGTCAFDVMVDTGETVHQISTVCDRGDFDLLAHSAVAADSGISVLEFSLGLDRILYCIMKKILEGDYNLNNRVNPYSIVVYDLFGVVNKTVKTFISSLPYTTVCHSRSEIKKANRDLIGTIVTVNADGTLLVDVKKRTPELLLLLRLIGTNGI
jgi:glycyl-tRNA synthetase (class II)